MSLVAGVACESFPLGRTIEECLSATALTLLRIPPAKARLNGDILIGKLFFFPFGNLVELYLWTELCFYLSLDPYERLLDTDSDEMGFSSCDPDPINFVLLNFGLKAISPKFLTVLSLGLISNFP